MPSDIVFPSVLLHRKVGPGAVLTESLFFPEISRLAATRALAADATRRNLIDTIASLPTEELLRRRGVARSLASPLPAGLSRTVREFNFDLIVHPPRASEAWREPVVLRFHAVVWEHPGPVSGSPGKESPAGPGVVLARVPALAIEVIAEPTDDLTAILRKETLSTLRRLNLTTGLLLLSGVQTTTAFQLEFTDLKVPIPTLKERAARAQAEAEAEFGKKPVLQQVATLMYPTRLEAAYEMDEAVRQVADALTAKPPQSVLLVGPGGVGKTAVVRELVRRWREFALGSMLFYQTSGARIVAGQSGFGMWEQRCQELVKGAAKRRAVLHVGPLVELMEVGKSEYNHTGIAAFLRPAIARGELLCIAECTPEQLPLIEKQDPQLPDAFRQITIEEPDTARGQTILAAFAANNRRRELTPAALTGIDRLHRRYATYSAYPGRPLRFLENLIRDGVPRAPITQDEVFEAFTRETGLPRPLIDPAVPLDLAETRRWFASRVIGQDEPVNLVVDLLATIKAGLTRPNRPIASLLFIGPTGVGKTEMAKALAEFLFGSRDRLSRFDLSEYADPIAVRRLVGGAFGSEGLLTAKIREQPFCVLLLDEVEKADASFFDLLLQALGEARLTDAGGRLADFRNAVVILTSNLGAESYRRGSAGFAPSGPATAEANEHFTRAVEQFLRPEMFNRLDRVVPFAPLGPEVVRRITDREWQKVLARDGVRFRGATVATEPELLDHLAAVGFDPRYGARPLKRAMERELLAPLARQMNRHSGDIPLSVEVGVVTGKPAVAVRPVPGVKPRSARQPSDPIGKLATEAQELRRWHQLAESCSVVRELNNEVYQLGMEEAWILRRQRARKKPLSAVDAETLAKLGRLRELADEVTRQRAAAFAVEDAAVLAFHDGVEHPPPGLQDRLAEVSREWDRLLLRLYALSAPSSDTVTLALFSEHSEHLGELAAAYQQLATRHKLMVEAVRYVLPGTEPPPVPNPPSPPPSRPPLPRRRAEDDTPDTVDVHLPTSVWKDNRLYLMTANPPKEILWRATVPAGRTLMVLPEGTIGVGLLLGGPGAHVRFGGEAGLHKIVTAQSPDPAHPDVLVKVSHESLVAFCPSEKLTRRGAIKADEPHRVYELDHGRITDTTLEQTFPNLYGAWADRLDPVIAANTRLRLLRLVLE